MAESPGALAGGAPTGPTGPEGETNQQEQQHPQVDEGPSPLEVLDRVEHVCKGVRILVPCNAALAPQATVFFVFWLFSVEQSEPPPWQPGRLEAMFHRFWAMHYRGTCAGCSQPGGKQVEYRFARPKGEPQREPDRLKTFFHQDLLRLLLVGKENAGTRRTRSYSLELTPEIYQYCFDARPWDTRAWCSQAVRCWRLLCQRGAARKSVECVASLESMRGHEPAMAFNRLHCKLGEGLYSQVWQGIDVRPGVAPRVSLALKVYGDETHELTGAENYGNLELRLRLLEEAQSEISNLHYLHDRFPDCAICFPLFHAVERLGPFSYRVTIAFPRRECTLSDLIKANPSGLPVEWIRRVLDRVLTALVALQTSPDESTSSHALRDLKPANILLEPSSTPEMRVELCDMQSMVQLPCATEDPAAKQQVKDTPMTVYYKSPEVRRGSFAGRHSDMWALGCSVLEACRGKRWEADWSKLMEDDDINQFVEREIAGLATTDPWVLAVLRNTLRADPGERLLASQLLALKDTV